MSLNSYHRVMDRLRAIRPLRLLLAAPLVVVAPGIAAQEGERRQIEEIIVTAEHRESSISDTSIAITAFDGDFIEDFGIRNQEDLQNYIPGTVIEPFDISIRGVTRASRALGNDPGVATYFNGVFDENFGIASSEGGLFDVERIEVLRGPQGTLYGRNAIGGAVNFISKRPTQEFEGEIRGLVGEFNTGEIYGVVSGPIIQDVLAARFTGTKRKRRGNIEELDEGRDLNSIGDENYALALEFTPTDRLTVYVRGNERSVNQVANGTATILLNTGTSGTFSEDGLRNTTAEGFGFRQIDRSLSTADDFFNPQFFDASQEVFSFTSPSTGETIEAQRIRPGIDQAANDEPNFAFGTDPTLQPQFGDFGAIDGDELAVRSNDQNNLFFDQQGAVFDIEWAGDNLTAQYIYGYNDFSFSQQSDTDLTDNPFLDEQFFVSQENEVFSHELKLFYNLGSKVSVTSGLFYYDAKITQRGDFFDSTGSARFGETPDLSGLDVIPGGNPFAFLNIPVPVPEIFPGTGIGFDPNPGVFTARSALNSDARSGTVADGAFIGVTDVVIGPFLGDQGDVNIPGGPASPSTNTAFQTRSEREAFAVYTQGVIDISDKFALTLGVRWARDNLDGEENVFIRSEDPLAGLVFPLDTATPLSLSTLNVLIGALDPTTLQPTGNVPIRLQGVPASASLHRSLERTDNDVSWRANLDWTPDDNNLVFFSVTTGHRAGGFNLGNFTANPAFEEEALTAYELGYKGTLLDRRLQLNANVYYYDYENVQTAASSISAAGGFAASQFAVPEARIIGVEADVFYLWTERLSVGGNFSYTPSEVRGDFFLINPEDPSVPNSLFGPAASLTNINGNRLQAVPEWKATAFANYTVPLGDAGNVVLSTSLAYTGDVFFSAFEQDIDRAPEYYRWDFRAGWTNVADTIEVSAFINNITDDIGLRTINRDDEEEDFQRSAITTDPRLIGLEVRYRFGPGSR